MASIIARKMNEGKVVYRALVRIKGHPHASEHFEKKQDAKEWALKTEAYIKHNKHFKPKEADQKTLADLIDRYTHDEIPNRNHARNNRRQLIWWCKHLGAYFLSAIRPSMIAAC